MLIAAIVTQIASRASDPAHELSRRATAIMVFDERNGMLLGPRHPKYVEDARGR